VTGLSAAARGLHEELGALGRRRVMLEDLRRAFHRAAPDAVAAPDQRERLFSALDELARQGHLRFPAGPAAWDRGAEPPLPRSVLLPGGDAVSVSGPGPAVRYPWRPELAFAATLSLEERAFESLRLVNGWLRDCPGPHRTVPARERSLEVFGDEKALDRIARTRLFGPGRLSYTLLSCEPLSPPFIWRGVGEGDALLAVENYDTFHSLCRVLAERDTPVGAVAYGAGIAFARSVPHAAELGRPVRRILYFGDLDAPGLRIPLRAGRRAVRSGLPAVEPAARLYRLLLDRGRPAPYRHRPGEAEVRSLVRWLPRDLRERTAGILLSGRRVAQEWVGLEVLSAQDRIV